MNNNLISLAERVEKASGPDRELDLLIENAFGLAKFERDPRVVYGDADYNRVSPRAFTSSIDAAMLLVPPNSGYSIWAVIGKPPSAAIHPDAGWGEYHSGATVALAICSAALRARAEG